jgi:hypothetical protein
MTILSRSVLGAAAAALAFGGAALLAPVPASAQYGGWVFCAPEHGFCRAPAGALVRYGLHGVYAVMRSPPGGLPCDNSVFGDPLKGAHKICQLRY